MNIIHPPSPAWSGPEVGGITQSLVSTFITCPFQFYLYAYCGLQESKPLEPNLIWGDILHKGLEHRIRGDSLEDSITKMYHYQLKFYPTAPASYRYTTRNMLAVYPIKNLEKYGPIETEVGIDQPHLLHNGRTIKIRGKIDMLPSNHSMIGDHKGKGKHAASPDAIKAEISEDFQMNFYAHAKGNIENWIYDIIRIPEALPRTPQRKVSQSPEEWANWIFHTYSNVQFGFPIIKHPGLWTNQIPHFQPAEDIEWYVTTTINPLLEKICVWWDYVTSPGFDPMNPACYNHIFYKAPVRNFNPTSTYSYKCKFHAFLTGKEAFENLIRVPSFYPELEEK